MMFLFFYLGQNRLAFFFKYFGLEEGVGLVEALNMLEGLV